MRRYLPLVAVCAVSLAGFTATAAPVADGRAVPRQGQGAEGGNFEIRVYVCEQEPARGVGPAAATDPEGCRRADGVAVAIVADEGGGVAGCVTGERRPGSGSCLVLAPLGDRVVLTPEETRVVVIQDDATLPPGYAPRENPIRTLAYSEFAAAIFVNLPADHPAVGHHPAVGTWRGKGWHVTFHGDGTALATDAGGATWHGAWEPVGDAGDILYTLERSLLDGGEGMEGTGTAIGRHVLELGGGERLERLVPPDPSDVARGTPAPETGRG